MEENETHANKPIFRRLYERVFPTVADFFGMLAEQSANAAETTVSYTHLPAGEGVLVPDPESIIRAGSMPRK